MAGANASAATRATSLALERYLKRCRCYPVSVPPAPMGEKGRDSPLTPSSEGPSLHSNVRHIERHRDDMFSYDASQWGCGCTWAPVGLARDACLRRVGTAPRSAMMAVVPLFF